MNLYRFLFAGVFFAFSLSACGDSSPPDDNGETPQVEETPDDTSNYSPHVQQYIRHVQSICLEASACPNWRQYNGPESPDLCVKETLLITPYLLPWLYDARHLHIDEELLKAQEQFLNTTCSTSHIPDDVWSRITTHAIVGELEDGEACQDSVQCKSRGECALPEPNSAHPVCVKPTQAVGESCTASTDCISGPGKKIFCAIPPQQNEGRCATWDYPSPKNLNESCGLDSNGFAQPCKQELWCEWGTCVEPRRNGQICGGGLDSSGCAAGHVCQPVFVQNLGVCVKPTHLGEGEPCDLISQGAHEYCSFDQGLICGSDTASCVKFDFECFHDEDCESETPRCQLGTLTCGAPLALGGECGRDIHCASGKCDYPFNSNDLGTCVAQ